MLLLTWAILCNFLYIKKKSLDFSSEIKAFFLVHPAGVEPVAFRVGVWVFYIDLALNNLLIILDFPRFLSSIYFYKQK